MSALSVEKLFTLTGHRDCVYVLEQGPNPNLIFSGAGDGMIVLWDLNTPDQGNLIAKLPNSIYALHYHTATNSIIVGHNYDGIHVLDWQTKKEIGSLHIGNASIFDLKSIDNTLIIALGDGEVVLVDIETLTILKRFKSSNDSARAIAIHPSKKEYAIGFSDNIIRIYNAEDNSLQQEIISHTNSIFSVHYSPNGTKLFTTGRDAHLKIWDASNFELIDDIVAHMYSINSLAFSPNTDLLASCSMDKSIKLWDTANFRLLKVIDKSRHAGHGTSVNKLLWTAHQNYLVSASDDQTISVWSIKKS